jgi:hAT family C-terminal dimerisation region
MLAISAISAECERVFSSVKKMITAERNQLIKDIIQTYKYLKSW